MSIICQETLWMDGRKSGIMNQGSVYWSNGQKATFTSWGSGLPDNGQGKYQ
jgi:hypothetical protein